MAPIDLIETNLPISTNDSNILTSSIIAAAAGAVSSSSSSSSTTPTSSISNTINNLADTQIYHNHHNNNTNNITSTTNSNSNNNHLIEKDELTFGNKEQEDVDVVLGEVEVIQNETNLDNNKVESLKQHNHQHQHHHDQQELQQQINNKLDLIAPKPQTQPPTTTEIKIESNGDHGEGDSDDRGGGGGGRGDDGGGNDVNHINNQSEDKITENLLNNNESNTNSSNRQETETNDEIKQLTNGSDELTNIETNPFIEGGEDVRESDQTKEVVEDYLENENNNSISSTSNSLSTSSLSPMSDSIVNQSPNINSSNLSNSTTKTDYLNEKSDYKEEEQKQQTEPSESVAIEAETATTSDLSKNYKIYELTLNGNQLNLNENDENLLATRPSNLLNESDKSKESNEFQKEQVEETQQFNELEKQQEEQQQEDKEEKEEKKCQNEFKSEKNKEDKIQIETENKNEIKLDNNNEDANIQNDKSSSSTSSSSFGSQNSSFVISSNTSSSLSTSAVEPDDSYNQSTIPTTMATTTATDIDTTTTTTTTTTTATSSNGDCGDETKENERITTNKQSPTVSATAPMSYSSVAAAVLVPPPSTLALRSNLNTNSPSSTYNPSQQQYQQQQQQHQQTNNVLNNGTSTKYFNLNAQQQQQLTPHQHQLQYHQQQHHHHQSQLSSPSPSSSSPSIQQLLQQQHQPINSIYNGSNTPTGVLQTVPYAQPPPPGSHPQMIYHMPTNVGHPTSAQMHPHLSQSTQVPPPPPPGSSYLAHHSYNHMSANNYANNYHHHHHHHHHGPPPPPPSAPQGSSQPPQAPHHLQHHQSIMSVPPVSTPGSQSIILSPLTNQAIISTADMNNSSSAVNINSSTVPTPSASSTIYVHVDSGHVFQVQLGDEIREILGPATVKMVSNDGSQPVPIQLTTPSPGQLVQQIVDENGVLTHLILSSQQPAPPQPQPPPTSSIPPQPITTPPPPPPPSTTPLNQTTTNQNQLPLQQTSSFNSSQSLSLLPTPNQQQLQQQSQSPNNGPALINTNPTKNSNNSIQTTSANNNNQSGNILANSNTNQIHTYCPIPQSHSSAGYYHQTGSYNLPPPTPPQGQSSTQQVASPQSVQYTTQLNHLSTAGYNSHHHSHHHAHHSIVSAAATAASSQSNQSASLSSQSVGSLSQQQPPPPPPPQITGQYHHPSSHHSLNHHHIQQQAAYSSHQYLNHSLIPSPSQSPQPVVSINSLQSKQTSPSNSLAQSNQQIHQQSIDSINLHHHHHHQQQQQQQQHPYPYHQHHQHHHNQSINIYQPSTTTTTPTTSTSATNIAVFGGSTTTHSTTNSDDRKHSSNTLNNNQNNSNFVSVSPSSSCSSTSTASSLSSSSIISNKSTNDYSNLNNNSNNNNNNVGLKPRKSLNSLNYTNTAANSTTTTTTTSTTALNNNNNNNYSSNTSSVGINNRQKEPKSFRKYNSTNPTNIGLQSSLGAKTNNLNEKLFNTNPNSTTTSATTPTPINISTSTLNPKAAYYTYYNSANKTNEFVAAAVVASTSSDEQQKIRNYSNIIYQQQSTSTGQPGPQPLVPPSTQQQPGSNIQTTTLGKPNKKYQQPSLLTYQPHQSLKPLANYANNHLINEHQKQYQHSQFVDPSQQSYNPQLNYNNMDEPTPSIVNHNNSIKHGQHLDDNNVDNRHSSSSNIYETNNTSTGHGSGDLFSSSNKTSIQLNGDDTNKKLNQEQQDRLNSELFKHIDFYRSILNTIKKPVICDIEAQSVLVRLSPIEIESLNLNNNNVNKTNGVDSAGGGETAKSSSQPQQQQQSQTSNSNLIPANLDSAEVSAKLENFNYTLELSNETNLFNQVYTGDANEITLKDLKPNTKYYLRVFASLSSKCRGDYTDAVSFKTKECEPEQPAPPKQMGTRKKNEITLRWNSCNDNGSKLINYILEYKENNLKQQVNESITKTNTNGDEVLSNEEQVTSTSDQETTENEQEQDTSFVQVYKGPLKQFIVKKLTPSTCYAFRLAAENAHGISEFSRISLAYTSGCVPNVPETLVLLESTISSLTLSWDSKTQNELDYELQMIDTEDPASVAHGFITVYNGPLNVYKITELKRCCTYQFRLRAKNEEGYSGWSEAKKFKTNADVPKPPTKLKVKIQQHPTVIFKVSWDAPKEDGGDKIQNYNLQLADSHENTFITIYEGDQLEYTIEQQLKPGLTYKLRVSCSNSIGPSGHSDMILFVTPAVQPGKCLPPKLYGKPKANSFQIRWNYPDQDGGSPITSYEVKLIKTQESPNENELRNSEMNNGETTTTDNSSIVYKGNELNCTIGNLLPGRNYLVKIRAINKVGAGAWSEAVELASGAGAPDSPRAPNVYIKSSSCLLITWLEPANNGSPITEYRVEWSSKECGVFTQLYCGSSLKYELKGGGLQPATRYLFRVQAINANGPSSFSSLTECLTPASVPSVVNCIKLEEIKHDSLLISWKQPNSNGSSITFYNLDLTDGQSSSTSVSPYIVVNDQQPNCEYRIKSLQPDTLYKLRIQAANCVGVGHFSNVIKVKTKALAPSPPNLECVSTSYNSIKLKWNHVNGLNGINSSFSFIDSINSSSLLSSSSSAALLAASSASSSNSKLALNDYQIVYNLEMMNASSSTTTPSSLSSSSSSDDTEFTCVYKGPCNFFKVNKLQESSVYLFRICAANETGQGKWSDIYKFTTTKSPPLINKAPSISEITYNSCLIEWQSAKLTNSNNFKSDDSSTSFSLTNQENSEQKQQQQQQSSTKSDSLEYVVQLQSVKKDSDYREVYRGESCSYRLKDLDSNTEHNVRVCAIRLCYSANNAASSSSNNDQPVQRICSPFTSHTTFTTLKLNTNKTNSSNKTTQNDSASSLGSSLTKTQLNNQNKNTSKNNNLSRFIWPSFYLSLTNLTSNNNKNSNSRLNEPLSNNNHNNNVNLSHSQSKSNLRKIQNHSNKKSFSFSSSSSSLLSSSPIDSNLTNNQNEYHASNRHMTDQQWALVLIFILLIIAFVIAFIANSLYTSYLDDIAAASEL